MPEQPAVYTSLSALGAEAPLSPSEGGPGASSGTGGVSAALWRSALQPYFMLLHPNACATAAAATTTAASSSTNEQANERTPLLRSVGGTSIILAGKYVGGGCARNPTNADGLATDRWRSSGRFCCDADGQPCFSFGQAASGGDNAAATSTTTTTRRTPSGMILAAVAQVCYAVMSLLAATLARKRQWSFFNGVQMLVWQGGSTSIVCASVLLASNGRAGLADALLGPKGSRLWMWARAICCASSSALFVLVAHALPMGDLVTIIYLAPLVYNMASHLVFSSRHPFRSQLVSLSLWLGVVLMTQPVFLLGGDEQDDETVAAAPLDLPIWAGGVAGGRLSISSAWAYGVAAVATLMTVLSMALLDHRPVRVSAYHSMLSSGILCAVAGLFIEAWQETAAGHAAPHSSSFDALTAALVFATIFFAWWARLWQDLALFQTGACQLSLVSFLQPLLSTGVGLLVPDVAADVAALAGCLLVLVNLAWIASPLDEEEAHMPGSGSTAR